jgi:hypothetical protein
VVQDKWCGISQSIPKQTVSPDPRPTSLQMQELTQPNQSCTSCPWLPEVTTVPPRVSMAAAFVRDNEQEVEEDG